MKHLITCSNAGEAGFLQSMLASAGIEAEVRDGRSDIGAVPSAQLFVSPEQYAQAVDLIAHHRADAKKQRAPVHSAEGFPFLGIMGLTAIMWSLGSVVLGAVSIDSDSWQRLGLWKILLQLFAVGALALLWGLMIGTLVALICLISKVTWRKLSANSLARANSGGAQRRGTP